MSEDRVLEALRALSANDREREAPMTVEARLLREFRGRSARRGWRWLGIAAIAAGVVLAMFSSTQRASKPAMSTALPATQVPQPVARDVAPAAPAPRKAVRRVARAATPKTREVMTDFFPLMDSAPPFERGQILRVQLPAAAMRTVGLPVREDHLADPIQADVLVGEEGIPRAIRFVRFDDK
jgi:hypothetical protein